MYTSQKSHQKCTKKRKRKRVEFGETTYEGIIVVFTFLTSSGDASGDAGHAVHD